MKKNTTETPKYFSSNRWPSKSV